LLIKEACKALAFLEVVEPIIARRKQVKLLETEIAAVKGYMGLTFPIGRFIGTTREGRRGTRISAKTHRDDGMRVCSNILRVGRADSM
jgi:hypothetical protein